MSGERLVLSVRQPLAALFTDSIEKDLRALARSLGLKSAFVAVPEGADLRDIRPNNGPLPAEKAPAL